MNHPSTPEGTDFDLLVIGSGPAGQRAAITAAKLGARVAIVERNDYSGGVCLNTGTIPSKSLREAVLYLTGYRQRGYYGDKYRLKEKIKTGDLLSRTSHVILLERQAIHEELARNGVERITGLARLTGPNTVALHTRTGPRTVTAGAILVAVGTKPRRPDDVPFDTMNVLDSDGLFHNGTDLVPLPDSTIVVGAGVIGIEYASMFAALDIPVTLVDPRPNPLGFIEGDIEKILYDKLESMGMSLQFGIEHKRIELLGQANNPDARVRLILRDGRDFEADSLLFALGRTAVTADLGLAELGVQLDPRGQIIVDACYRTAVPSIYAAGDVIGFPALASTSSEQGRIAARNALGQTSNWCESTTLPFGIYTIPEISMVGRTSAQLEKDGEDFFVGTALWRENARGKIIGDLSGAMKLLFRRGDRRLIGAHIIGEGATELIHIAQAVMQFGGVDYLASNVFNYPTLSDAYKAAAINALERLDGTADRTEPLADQVLHGDLHQNFVRLSGEVRLPQGFF